MRASSIYGMVILIAGLTSGLPSQAAETELWPAQSLDNAKTCLWGIVADKMKVRLPADEALPPVRIEGPTSLKEMQDVAEVAWGMRPPTYVNFYDPASNQIFLMAQTAYYQKSQRTPFDSLVHEMVHVVQVLVKGANIHDGYADAYEDEAVRVQTWFRDSYKAEMRGWDFVCPEAENLAIM